MEIVVSRLDTLIKVKWRLIDSLYTLSLTDVQRRVYLTSTDEIKQENNSRRRVD